MKKVYFYASLFVLVIITFICIYKDFRFNYIVLTEISESKYNKIIESRKETNNKIELYYDGNIISYNEEDNYYLINIINYNKIYSDYKINVLEKNTSEIKIIMYNNNEYKISKLCISTLPIINITTTKEMKENSYGNVLLMNDEANAYDIKFHIRGGTSSLDRNSKKSYKVILMKPTDGESLLGMKISKEWILNPLYTDKSYIREQIGYHIWNNLNNEYLMHLKPVELILDGSYRGIYALQEPIGLDTFKANDSDLLVSIKYWRNDIHTHRIYDETRTIHSTIDEFEIEDGLGSRDIKRNLLLSFLDNIDGTNYSNLKVEYDLKSNSEYDLFINLIMAVDNSYKNEKILFRNENNKYIVYKMPWDLDWSINNETVSAKTIISSIYVDSTIPSYILKDSEFKKLEKDKYFEFRNTIYNEEYLNNLIDGYADELRNSGALDRSNSIESFEENIIRIKDFFKERINVLDKYYGGL